METYTKLLQFLLKNYTNFSREQLLQLFAILKEDENQEKELYLQKKLRGVLKNYLESDHDFRNAPLRQAASMDLQPH